MRELNPSELRYVTGGMVKGPGNGDVDNEPPVVVTAPGGGGGGGIISPPVGGGGSGTASPPPSGGGTGSGSLPPGYGAVGGFATEFANPIWGSNQQITGGMFGFSIGADKISTSMSQQAASVTNTYTMTDGETVGAAVNWANGNFSESIVGSGAYADMHFSFSVNSNAPDKLSLSYVEGGVTIGLAIDTTGATSESAAVSLYDNGSVHVTAGVAQGSGGTEKYLKFEDSAHPDEHYELMISHNTTSGWSAGIGIGFPY
ncbi:hypothetical protein L2Y94_19405 [Luteibacter aegosomatis]|uniref:hypothetical protein n=1 Tax=Luteibacter aegosomatis TaxID=2911537 RepID=UPI001FF774F1|nr:hypothetical protein [Luteibacter aegosomatis]UPG85445.1 hypothetical protein L2Y94_19405 [Luteibacter aegosomatis]